MYFKTSVCFYILRETCTCGEKLSCVKSSYCHVSVSDKRVGCHGERRVAELTASWTVTNVSKARSREALTAVGGRDEMR